jgi:TPR repeat protein
VLLTRGDSLFRTGDLASARLFYERAANAGSGQAALRLGESYDPHFLEKTHLRGARSDTETAILWYKRARDLGASEATILLDSIASK